MPFAESAPLHGENGVFVLAARLLGALVLGWLAADIYKRTCDREAPASFRVTLVLLTILIAAVTQVIGDSVARAFSLVGALSIVRFRTVVQDTRDTAFVIFAVTLGMAVGAGDYWVATTAFVVVALAAFATAIVYGTREPVVNTDRFRLRVVAGSRHNLDALLEPSLTRFAARHEFVEMSTQKGGAVVEAVHDLWLREGVKPASIVESLNGVEGIQSASIAR